MRDRPSAGLLSAGLGVLAAGAAVGSVLGSALERRMLRRPLADAADHMLGFGAVHSPPQVVAADDGVQLYVEVDEPDLYGDDPVDTDLTVVFVHGYALNLDCWHYQRLTLRGRFRCVFFDQRGHGRSGRGEPGPVRVERLARDLAAVVAATVPPGAPVVLVGHSMGGMTVLGLAAAHPELFGTRVAGVALVSTSAGKLGEVTLGVPAGAARLLRLAAPAVFSALGRAPRLVDLGRRTGNDLEFMITRIYSFGSDVPPALVDFVRQMNAGTPIAVVSDFFGAFADHDAVAAVPNLRGLPCLVLVGADDLLTPADHSRDMAAALPDAELVVVPECGHMVMLEHPDVVDARLGHLLDKVLDR